MNGEDQDKERLPGAMNNAGPSGCQHCGDATTMKAPDEAAADLPVERPGTGLSPADTASGDVTASGGARFDRDLSDHPPAMRNQALTPVDELSEEDKPK